MEIDVNGQKDMWHVSDGVASKPLNYGTYHYTISANRYHTESGTFSVSDTQTEKTVALQPKFGWLSITSSSAQDAYVYVTNTQTGTRQSLGTLPINRKDLDSGTYTLLIQKDKYKDYTTNFTIEEGKTTTLNPTLEANFVRLTLTTALPSDIYIDNQKLGTNRWTGTLELGEYVVETRRASHHSAYTNVRITPQSAGQTITLNNPLPIYGSMMLTSSPADAVVYVDGVKKGLTPLIVNELLIGAHRVRIEKEGYDTQEKTVTITEGQESVVEYTLTKDVKPVLSNTPTTSSSMAQNLKIVQNFRKIENSSAVVMYHNQFGQYEKPAMDDTFPYAVVRVLLEGNAHEVKEAKKMLGIYTGVLSQGAKASYLDFENEILFLIPSSSGHVELGCGDGCARQTILELPKLQSNALYVGKVHYTPMQEPVQSTTTQVQNDATNFSSTNHSTTSETMIHGRVVDSKGEPLIGASIIEKGTANGTITDFDGEFTLTVKGNAILEVNYVGFKSQILNAQKVMDITLLKKGERLKNK